MNWQAFLKTILHAAIGAAVAAAVENLVPVLHVDPQTGAIIGSALSSILSLHSEKPR